MDLLPAQGQPSTPVHPPNAVTRVRSQTPTRRVVPVQQEVRPTSTVEVYALKKRIAELEGHLAEARRSIEALQFRGGMVGADVTKRLEEAENKRLACEQEANRARAAQKALVDENQVLRRQVARLSAELESQVASTKSGTYQSHTSSKYEMKQDEIVVSQMQSDKKWVASPRLVLDRQVHTPRAEDQRVMTLRPFASAERDLSRSCGSLTAPRPQQDGSASLRSTWSHSYVSPPRSFFSCATASADLAEPVQSKLTSTPHHSEYQSSSKTRTSLEITTSSSERRSRSAGDIFHEVQDKSRGAVAPNTGSAKAGAASLESFVAAEEERLFQRLCKGHNARDSIGNGLHLRDTSPQEVKRPIRSLDNEKRHFESPRHLDPPEVLQARELLKEDHFGSKSRTPIRC